MDVIKALYPHVFTLERWLYHCDGSGILRSTLIKDDDTQSFKDLVETTIVAMPDANVQISGFSFSQNLYQREVVLRTIEKLIRCDGAGKNILTQGFNVISNDMDAHVSSGASIEYRYPNSNVNRLHFKVWKQLLMRIGDSMMMYLLEKASIFILLAPTSYLQIAGPPIYNAWPYEVGKTFPVRHEKHQSKRFYNKTKLRKKNNAVQKKAQQLDQTSRDSNGINDRNNGTRRKVEDVIIDQDRIVENESKRTRIEFESNCDKLNSQEYEHLEKWDTSLCNKTQATSKADDERPDKDFDTKAAVRTPVELAMTFVEKQDLNLAPIKSIKRKRNSVASELTSPEIPSKKRHKASSKDGPNNEKKAVNEKVDRAKDIQKFKPYDHLIYLPRTDILYNRNLRERVQRSATIASLDSDRSDLTQFLYRKIFCETSVNTDSSPVKVVAPVSAQVIAPESTVSSSKKGQDEEDVYVESEQISKVTDSANCSNVLEPKHTDACNPLMQDNDSISSSENDIRSQTLKNKTVLLGHPSFMNSDSGMDISLPNEPRRQKTGLRGFRPGPTQTGLYSQRRWLEA